MWVCTRWALAVQGLNRPLELLPDFVEAGACRCQEKLAAVIPRSGYLVWAPSTSSSATMEEDSTAKSAAAAGTMQTSVVADSACRIKRSETAEAQDAMEKGCSPYAALLE